MKLLCEVLGVRKHEVTRLFLGLHFLPFSQWFSSSPLEATGFREACQDTSILRTLGKFVLVPVSSFVKRCNNLSCFSLSGPVN